MLSGRNRLRKRWGLYGNMLMSSMQIATSRVSVGPVKIQMLLLVMHPVSMPACPLQKLGPAVSLHGLVISQSRAVRICGMKNGVKTASGPMLGQCSSEVSPLNFTAAQSH